MCHSSESRPPAPPISTPTDDHAPITLTGADGVRSLGYAAHPAYPSQAGVVILPDVRGAHGFYRELAVRFAEAGVHAVVIDYYGHLTDEQQRGDDFEWRPLLPQVDAGSVQRVVAAAIDELTGTGVRQVISVGFCFGGSQSWLLAGSELPLAGVVGFYGDPDLVRPRLGELHRSMLLLVAGADVATSRDSSEAFDRELTAAGVPHRQHLYEGAPHSFFDRSHEQWRDACTDAWQRVLGFIAEHGGAGEAPRLDEGSAEQARRSAYRTLDEVLPELGQYAREFAHGTINARSGLSRRDRELVILGALIALGDTGRQLRAHAAAALEHGVSGPELVEIILQALPYVGFPRTINATLELSEQLRTVGGSGTRPDVQPDNPGQRQHRPQDR